MIEEQKLTPCSWENSSLRVRMVDGSMPPGDSGPALPPRSIEMVGSFVDGLCSELGQGERLANERSAAAEILRTSCGSCHGSSLGSPDAGGSLVSIEDIPLMIERGQIIPCSSGGSPIIQRIRDGSMPPSDSAAPRPTFEQLNALADFIDRPCTWP
jgi:hypothetical protein